MSTEKGHLLHWDAVNTGLYNPYHTDPAKRRRYEEQQQWLKAAFPRRQPKRSMFAMTETYSETREVIDPNEAFLVVAANGDMRMGVPDVDADELPDSFMMVLAIGFRWTSDPEWREELVTWYRDAVRRVS